MGNTITFTQFYLYGRRHFTQTGYRSASKRFVPGELEDANLEGKNYLVTGANSGVGKEVAQYIASKGGTVFMLCRNPERAEAAKQDIVDNTKSDKVHTLIADCSLKSSVKSMFESFLSSDVAPTKLHGLVCNAGALFNEKGLTNEGLEKTFALHLLVGSYYLTKLCMPLMLEAAKAGEEPRVVMVSSGGMYNTKWPKWDTATGQMDTKEYSGNLAYAYQKRGQVLLCEEWNKAYESQGLKFVSSHPGWAKTPAVAEAYGSKASGLEPMRTPWEGADGIAWLCGVKAARIEGGAFYLDREPQRKHMAGAFFSEGTRTKNTPEEVKTFMEKLDECLEGLKV